MHRNTNPSSLSKLLRKNIPGNIRQRGEDYYRWGAVGHLEGGPSFVEARVKGTRLYDVAIDYDSAQQVLEGSCTCPYFAGNGACKHVWAVLLAAEKADLLSDAAKDRCSLLVDVDSEEDPDLLDDEEYENPHESEFLSNRVKPVPQKPRGASSRGPSWKQHFQALQEQLRLRQGSPSSARPPSPPNRRMLYVFDAAEGFRDSALPVEIAAQDRKKDGEWGKIRSLSMRRAELDRLPDPQDRRILSALAGAEEDSYSWAYAGNYYRDSMLQRVLPLRFLLSPQLSLELLPSMCATGRCRLRRAKGDFDLSPVVWDDGPSWEFGIEVVPDGQGYTLTGALRRGEQSIPLNAPLLTTNVLLFTNETAARLESHQAFDWLLYLRQHGPIRVPRKDGGAMLERLLTLPVQAPLRLPPELQVEEVRISPKPRLKVRKPREMFYGARLQAQWEFDYGGAIVPAADPRPAVYQAEPRRLLLRDREAEERAAARLRELGFRDSHYDYRPEHDLLELTPRHLPKVVMQLLGEGWRVEAEGKLYRKPGQIDIRISSGVDWFELNAEFDFDGQSVPLPRILQAMRLGDSLVPLGDGTFGLLPEEWLKKYAPLVSLGEPHKDRLRFRPTQVAFLDLLLAAMPEGRCDEVFTRAAGRIRGFDGVKPADPPPEFTGQLRPYQRYGLGWFHFLSDFRFGGCLADDMGLGKTVQVLARLEERRQEKLRGGENGKPPRPSVAVVPRTLIFNWKQEAARFTPGLRILDHTGVQRIGRNGGESLDHFCEYDLVLTTYGTLRRDAAKLKDVPFDYAILDEAQAVKNPASASAKAVRLLQAQQRLVLTGTPVENHLGDLWSIFEFLNPGMLGSASVFKRMGAGGKQVDAETRELLARALRPFILRRTKEQVEPDLPPKLEQTLYCELEEPQRKLYNELRDFYRQTLLARVSRQGLNRSKIQVLEALLRLRQAACHPGLIDPARRREPSAKLDALLPQIEEVTEAGHKALVFSQFTSLLSIVRERLDSKAIRYEYLDGQTRDRASRVQCFQGDLDCRLFLISLKAGGLGLNLTAAEYVFLLDPWWNPAVEAQAIDRAHRIGQESRVFAYRLIARDTVEEKVLELQKTKRELADAIINVDNSLIRNLGREDLELLLS